MTTAINTENESRGSPQDHLEDLLLELLPLQGPCDEEEYLRLTDYTNRLVEFTDGCILALPIPTDHHQAVLQYLFLAIHSFLHPLGGKVHFAALRLRIRPGKFREPDLILLRSAADPRRQNRYWLGADLVLEVVSPNPVRHAICAIEI